MTTHFKSYVANFNRVRLSEMVDFYALQSRMDRAQASLVVHPLTGEFYRPDSAGALLSQDELHAQ